MIGGPIYCIYFFCINDINSGSQGYTVEEHWCIDLIPPQLLWPGPDPLLSRVPNSPGPDPLLSRVPNSPGPDHPAVTCPQFPRPWSPCCHVSQIPQALITLLSRLPNSPGPDHPPVSSHPWHPTRQTQMGVLPLWSGWWRLHHPWRDGWVKDQCITREEMGEWRSSASPVKRWVSEGPVHHPWRDGWVKGHLVTPEQMGGWKTSS